ncbi:GGDEF domain-containing protein [Secundilactobacillus oryzae]|nr:GGDEF domain-containing protein [Secundilactobacillus oryzae]
MANYDKLTNVKNYSTYQREIFNFFGVARTKQQPLVIAVLDIDHFKLVNDRLGHLAGNQVLMHVAETLDDTLAQYSRSYGFYRTGGEEFTIVFPDTTVDEAFQVITNCWRVVRETPFNYRQTDIDITISVGVADMIVDDQSPNDMYQRADESLYLSKEHGRDAVTINGETQKLLTDLGGSKLRRRANELILQHFDQDQQRWIDPGEYHLSIEERITLIRDALVNSRIQSIVISLSVASFLNEELATELIDFTKGPNGPEKLYLELKQLPERHLLTPMAEHYRKNGISIIIGQIGNNRHFERVEAILNDVDGIKLTIDSSPLDDRIPSQAKKDIQFWGGITTKKSLIFIVDGIKNEAMLSEMRQQTEVDFVEGDGLDTKELPLLKS